MNLAQSVQSAQDNVETAERQLSQFFGVDIKLSQEEIDGLKF